MYGFTESYNISVAAALVLFNLTEKLRQADIRWHLTDDERLDLKLSWTKKSISRSDVIERQFLKTFNSR